MKQKSFVSFLSVFLIFLAVIFLCTHTDARRLSAPDDTNTKIKVIIDTSSIKKIHDFGDKEFRREDHIFGQRIEFDSKVLGEERAVYIHLPSSYAEGSNRYPVIFVLDGRD